MDLYLSLASVLGALLIGAISPGPSFVLVARTSIAVSRVDGLCMAVGMGVGGVIFAVLVLAGLQAVLSSVPWLYTALKLCGGLYLVFLAVQIWRGAKQPLIVSQERAGLPASPLKSFALALLTQISNPKAVVVYGSIFAALLPPDLPLAAMLLLPVLVFLIETGWYTIVALMLSTKSSTALYLNSKTALDRFASLVMGALGARLLLESGRHSTV